MEAEQKKIQTREKGGFWDSFFFSLFAVCVVLLIMRGMQAALGEVSFSFRYFAPLGVLILPFFFPLLQKEELFHEQVYVNKNLSLKTIFFLVLCGVITFWKGEFSVDLLIGYWALGALIYGFSGKLSFFGALMMLLATIASLLVDQQAYAETFAIYLYYFLCIGVLVELLGEKLAPILASPKFSFTRSKCSQCSKIKAILSRSYFWNEYGKEVLLILYIGVLVYLFLSKKILLMSGMGFVLSLGTLIFLYRILGSSAFEDLDVIISLLRKFLEVGMLMFFIISFFIPGFTLPIWWVLLVIWFLLALYDYLSGRPLGIKFEPLIPLWKGERKYAMMGWGLLLLVALYSGMGKVFSLNMMLMMVISMFIFAMFVKIKSKGIAPKVKKFFSLFDE